MEMSFTLLHLPQLMFTYNKHEEKLPRSHPLRFEVRCKDFLAGLGPYFRHVLACPSFPQLLVTSSPRSPAMSLLLSHTFIAVIFMIGLRFKLQCCRCVHDIDIGDSASGGLF